MLNIRCCRELVNLESFVQNIASCLSLLCVLCQGLFSIAQLGTSLDRSPTCKPWNLARLFSKRNMSYDSGGDMFDLAKLVSDIYVCGNFHCCIIFLSTAPIRPGYAISYYNCGLSIVVEIKITARKIGRKKTQCGRKRRACQISHIFNQRQRTGFKRCDRKITTRKEQSWIMELICWSWFTYGVWESWREYRKRQS